ncbi:hypothetical protein [Streptomyces alanosinicus]|uniref:Uncharacterized protein n=1 Tax=Streptomyces alanosinicus TaxID=68171 RepID=A0A918YCT7_9ACTN|nr:hypothetical protein [Streptomyces alanosinicus]GHD98283.1 hypothetical protein GCM10010339_04840 [Streptomyces alanosinicus]
MHGRLVHGEALALLLVATGCAATSERHPKAVLAAAPEPTKEVRDLLLPYDRYQLSVNDIYLIGSAQDLLTRDCMKKRGYDWEVIGDRKQYPDVRNRRRYGVIEPAVARELGYRANPRLLGSTDVTVREMDRQEALSPAAKKAAPMVEIRQGVSRREEGGGRRCDAAHPPRAGVPALRASADRAASLAAAVDMGAAQRPLGRGRHPCRLPRGRPGRERPPGRRARPAGPARGG